MKKTLLTTIVCIFFSGVQGQSNIQELPDGKHANFKLSKVNQALVGGVDYFDLEGKSTKYLVSLDFGKNTLNIQLFETSTGKLVWAYFGMKKSINFKPNREKSNTGYSVYEFELNEPSGKTTCQVSYMLGANNIIVSLDYSVISAATKKVTQSIIATGEL